MAPKTLYLQNPLFMPNGEGFGRRASIRANGLLHLGEWIYFCACSFLFDQVLKANFGISRHLDFRGYIYSISVEIPRHYSFNPKTFLEQIFSCLKLYLVQQTLTQFNLLYINLLNQAYNFLVYLSSTTMDSTFYIY